MGPKYLIFILLCLPFYQVMGAACCGGGTSLPTLITGDYRGQVVLSGSNAAITHDSNVSGKVNKRNGANQKIIEILTLSTSYLITPYWQVGLTLPYKFNTHKTRSFDESSRGASDIKAQLAYEFLPEYSFSLWRPKGYVFFEQTFPNSRSTYNADMPLRSDSLGNGLYTTALGMSFVKTIYSFDILFMSEIHKGLKRKFEQNSESFSVNPELGGSALLGIGYSPYSGSFRIGSTLLYSQEGSREIVGNTTTVSRSSYFWEIGVNLSYLFNDISFSIAYKDQSFLGEASNTTLSKSLGVSIIKLFEL